MFKHSRKQQNGRRRVRLLYEVEKAKFTKKAGKAEDVEVVEEVVEVEEEPGEAEA